MASKKQKQTTESPQSVGFQVSNIPVSEIHPSDDNPRSDIDEESVKELVESIKAYGILQPVTIRPDEEYGTEASPWVMVCGHRRLKACQILGLDTIPAIIREDLDDDAAYDLMIVENLHRKDLDPLDEAIAYKNLIEPYPTTGYQGTTIKELAARFGKSEKYIRGRLSLNELIDGLKTCLKAGTLTLGAALRLATLPEKMQTSFYEDNTPGTSRVDDNVIVSPMGIDQVVDFIEYQAYTISCQAFSEDPEEKWNTTLHKCAGCPFNSASQGALFADMVSQGECNNPDCIDSKTLAYARHIFNYWLPNFKSANQHFEPGDVALLIDDVFYGESAEKELFEKLKDRAAADHIKPIKGGGFQRVWDDDEIKTRSDMFRVLNLRDLCQGRNGYMQYYVVPGQSSGPNIPKRVDHCTIYKKLLAAKDACMNKIHEKLVPMGAAALESYFATSAVLQGLPAFLENYIALRLIDGMSYSGRSDLTGNAAYFISAEDVADFLKEHTLADVVKAALMDFTGANTTPNGKKLLEQIMITLADDATRTIISDIRAEFQPKIDSLVEQLRDMGYDEYNVPLPEPDSEGDAGDESNGNEAAES